MSTALPAGWINAAPFRAHLRHLMSTSGLPWQVIAELADVPPQSVRLLLSGRGGRPIRRIPTELGRRLYALTTGGVQAARYRQVSSAEALAQLQWLLANGRTISELSRRLNLPASTLRNLNSLRPPRCPEAVALQIQAGYQRLNPKAASSRRGGLLAAVESFAA